MDFPCKIEFCFLSLRSMAFSFRISNNTICGIVAETCSAIWGILSPIYLKFPSRENDWNLIANQFKEKWQMANCLGSIDGKHIELNKPAKTEAKFRNYQHFLGENF
jgi:hypothetical protein